MDKVIWWKINGGDKPNILVKYDLVAISDRYDNGVFKHELTCREKRDQIGSMDCVCNIPNNDMGKEIRTAFLEEKIIKIILKFGDNWFDMVDYEIVN